MTKPPKFPAKIELVIPSSLKPYQGNARTHSPEQVAQIAASITEFGFTNPILVDGQGTVIAGHGRLLAAKSLMLKQVPVIRLTHLNNTQRRALVLADNKLALNAGWDNSLLASELEMLKADGFELEVLGFDDRELEELLKGDEPIPGDQPPAGPRALLSQIVFTVTDDQKNQIERALDVARGMGTFGDTGNDNEQANAISRVCELFVTKLG